MAPDLADSLEGTPGRFLPEELRGELAEAEHLARYRWAARLATGRRVLDAGCDLGDGAAILAEVAASVDAIDAGEALVEAARARAGDGVRFTTGALRALPFADDAFDLVVCLNAVEDPPRALDEFRRVLGPGGVLVMAEPVEPELRRRFGTVRLVRQQNFLSTAILPDGGAAAGAPLDGAEVLTAAAGEDAATLALAGDGEVPEPPALVALASTAEARAWLERFEEQQIVLQRQADAIARLEQTTADRADLLRRLSEAETELQRHPALAARLEVAEAEQRRLALDLDRLRARADLADHMEASLSWRLTKPLRLLKRTLG